MEFLSGRKTEFVLVEYLQQSEVFSAVVFRLPPRIVAYIRTNSCKMHRRDIVCAPVWQHTPPSLNGSKDLKLLLSVWTSQTLLSLLLGNAMFELNT